MLIFKKNRIHDFSFFTSLFKLNTYTLYRLQLQALNAKIKKNLKQFKF